MRKKRTKTVALTWLLTCCLVFESIFAGGITAAAQEKQTQEENEVQSDIIDVPKDEGAEEISEDDVIWDTGLSAEYSSDSITSNSSETVTDEELSNIQNQVEGEEQYQDLKGIIDTGVSEEECTETTITSNSIVDTGATEEEELEGETISLGIEAAEEGDKPDLQKDSPKSVGDAIGDSFASTGAIRPWITPSEKILNVTAGCQTKIMISWGCAEDWIINGDCGGEAASAGWGKQSGNSAELYITGQKKGFSLITLFLRNKATNRILATTYVWVFIAEPNPTLSVSADSLSMLEGESAQVTVSVHGATAGCYLKWTRYTNKCTPEWLTQSGNNFPMSVKGNRAGDTRFTVFLVDKSGKTLDTKSVSVTIYPLPQMSFSKSSLTIGQNAKEALDINLSNMRGGTNYDINASYDSRYISCGQFYDWNGMDHLKVDVTGKKKGSCTLKVIIKLNGSSRILATCSIKITIRESRPRITSSASNLSMNPGDDASVTMTVSGTSEAVSVGMSVSGSNCQATWGSATDTTVPINIHAVTKGMSIVTVKLYRTSDKKYLASTFFIVTVTGDVSFTASTTDVIQNVGEETEIKFTASGTSSITMVYNSDGSAICSRTWTGRWSDDGKSTWLKIRGLEAGTTKFAVYLYDSATKTVLGTIRINVKVRGASLSATVGSDSKNMKVFDEALVEVCVTGAPEGSQLIADGSNRDIVDYAWVGGWNGNSTNLQMRAKTSGSVTTYLVLKDSSGNTLASLDFQTTVTGCGVNDVTYNFNNSDSSFGYGAHYRIPLQAYRIIYGNTRIATDLFQSSDEWGGSCFGMSSTSTLFTGMAVRRGAFRASANRTSELHPSDWSDTFGMNLTRFIEAMQVSWNTSVNGEFFDAHANDLSSLCDAVGNGMTTFKRQPVIVSIWGETIDENGNPKQSGHSIVGLYEKKITNTAGRLYVYDPNYPGQIRYISLTYKNGEPDTWSYNMNDSYDWGTGRRYSYIGYTDFATVRDIWQRRGSWSTERSAGTSMNLMIINSDNFEIYDYNDELAATVVDGELTVEGDRNIYRIMPVDGAYNNKKLIYLPTDDVYTVKNKDTALEIFEVTLTNVELNVDVKTTAAEVVLAVNDAENLQNAFLTAQEGEFYDISIHSSREDDPESRQIVGIGTGTQVGLGIINGSLETTGDVTVSSCAQIESEAGEGGIITPSGITEVKYGDNKAYQIKADAGYRIKDVTVDGKSIGAVESYEFEQVNSDHSIRATFEKTEAISSDGTTAASADNTKKFIQLNAKKVIMQKKQSTAGLVVSMAKGDSVTSVASSNKKIVKASIKNKTTGVIRLKAQKKKGKARITVTLQSGLKKTIPVQVQSGKVKTKKIILSETKLTLEKGQKYNVNPTLSPFTSQEKVSYKTSNKKIAIVTKKGVIQAKRKGKVTITVRSGKKKKTMKIKVK